MLKSLFLQINHFFVFENLQNSWNIDSDVYFDIVFVFCGVFCCCSDNFCRSKAIIVKHSVSDNVACTSE